MAADPTYGPKIQRRDDGDKLAIASGGTMDIESGGVWQIAGVTVTSSAADLNALDSGLLGTDSAVFTFDQDSSAAKVSIDTNSATGDFTAKIVPDNLGSNITLTLPSATGTIALTTDTSTDLDLGSSGTAGSLDIFPTTAVKGKLSFTATDNTGDTTLSITNELQGQATTLKIPDVGTAAGQFVCSNSDFTGLFNLNGADRTVSLSGDLTTAGDVTYTGAFAASFTIPDASTWVFPVGGGTLATTSGAETGTTSQTFDVDSDNATGVFQLKNTQGGTNNTVILQTTATTQAVTLTLPDAAADTVAVLGLAQTFTGATQNDGTQDFRGNISSGGSNPNIDWSGSSGTFDTPTGTATLNGSVTSAAGAFSFNLGNFTSTFTTPTGTNTLSGNVSIASGKTVTHVGGVSNVDFSASSGTFLTCTGINTIGGTVSVAANKDIACVAGTTQIDWSLGTGAFDSTTGANSLNGVVTLDNATTPSLTCATGKTNTGFVSVLGKTSGGIKVLPIDAGTSLLTISNEAQTQTTTMLIPDLNVATGQFACVTSDDTVDINANASDRTISLSGNLTTANDLITAGNFSLTLTTSAGTNVTLPTTGTLATLGGTEILTNKTIDGDDNTVQDLSPDVAKILVEGLTATPADPAIPFVVTFKPVNGSGETLVYTVPAGKTLRVLDVRGYKTNGAGGAGDTVTIQNVGNAITDAIVTNLADKLVFQAASYDDAQRDVAAATELRCVTAFNTDAACSVNVTCCWV